MRKSYREAAVACVPIPSLDDISDAERSLARAIVSDIQEYEARLEPCRLFTNESMSFNLRCKLAIGVRAKREELDERLSLRYGFRGPAYLALSRTGYDDLQEHELTAEDLISMRPPPDSGVGYVRPPIKEQSFVDEVFSMRSLREDYRRCKNAQKDKKKCKKLKSKKGDVLIFPTSESDSDYDSDESGMDSDLMDFSVSPFFMP